MAGSCTSCCASSRPEPRRDADRGLRSRRNDHARDTLGPTCAAGCARQRRAGFWPRVAAAAGRFPLDRDRGRLKSDLIRAGHGRRHPRRDVRAWTADSWPASATRSLPRRARRDRRATGPPATGWCCCRRASTSTFRTSAGVSPSTESICTGSRLARRSARRRAGDGRTAAARRNCAASRRCAHAIPACASPPTAMRDRISHHLAAVDDPMLVNAGRRTSPRGWGKWHSAPPTGVTNLHGPAGPIDMKRRIAHPAVRDHAGVRLALDGASSWPGLAGASLAAVLPAARGRGSVHGQPGRKPLDFKPNALYSTAEKREFLRGGHRLQQLLRIRHRQIRSGGACAPVAAASLVRPRRWRMREARHARARGPADARTRSRSASIACAASRPGRW